MFCGLNAKIKIIALYLILKIWSEKFGVSSFHFCSEYLNSCLHKNRRPVFNSLPNDENLDLFKLKAFADDILYLAKMTKYVFEDLFRKGENACHQHFLLFPLCL